MLRNITFADLQFLCIPVAGRADNEHYLYTRAVDRTILKCPRQCHSANLLPHLRRTHLSFLYVELCVLVWRYAHTRIGWLEYSSVSLKRNCNNFSLLQTAVHWDAERTKWEQLLSKETKTFYKMTKNFIFYVIL